MESSEPLFLRNAIVFDGSKTVAGQTSVLTGGGLIAAVGNDQDLAPRARGVGAREFDAGGAFLMPGIVDSHVHVIMLGESLQRVDLFGCRSAEECAVLLARKAAETEPGQWIIARGWRKSVWPSDEFPTAAVVDAAVPGHPVFCSSFDGHSGWANSLAMRLAGVSASTEDPAGGEVTRDASGAPTGIFKENAQGLLRKVIPAPSAEERRRSFQLALAHLNALGITGVHDMSGFGDFELAAEVAEAGELCVRYGGACRPAEIDKGAAAHREDDPRALVRMLGVKMFIDGSLNSQTAAMFEPYVASGRGGAENRGILTQEYGDLRDRIATANGAGLPVLVHAIGDRGVHLVLDAIEEAGDTSLCNRIEHASLLRDGDADRMAALRVHASVQPSHLITDIEPCDRHLGARGRRMFIFRQMVDKGVNLAFGSDAPVVSADPRETLFAAVLRTDLDGRPAGGWYPDERLGLAEALSYCGVGPALSTGAADAQGRVAPGFCADLTLFAESPFERDPGEVRALTLLMTIVDGRVVHRTT